MKKQELKEAIAKHDAALQELNRKINSIEHGGDTGCCCTFLFVFAFICIILYICAQSDKPYREHLSSFTQ